MKCVDNMRVLFLLSHFLDGGIDTILLQYLKGLVKMPGFTVSLAISVRMNELEVFRNQIPSEVKVEYLVDQPYLCNPRIAKLKGKISAVSKLWDNSIHSIIRRHKIQSGINKLAQSHDLIVDFDASQSEYLTKCPIPTIAWLHFSMRKLNEVEPLKTQQIIKQLDQYTRIVTICEAMRTELSEMAPNLASKLTTIYNPIDQTSIVLKSEDPIDFHDPYILTICRLNEDQKDVSTLIRAYAQTNISEKLVIIGKGKDEDTLKKLTHDLKIADRVYFAGFHENPYPWLRKSKAFVLSSKYEGFGIVLVEAMYLNIPVISSNCPVGPAEILDSGQAGLLVPPGDHIAMADAITQITTDNSLRKELTKKATKRADLFTFDSQLTKMINLFSFAE